MPPRQLNIGVASLGRMGFKHAENLSFNVPRAKLVAVCDPFEAALERAKDELPEGVALYKTFEEMLAHPEIEAVVIATPTSMHAAMCIQAFEAGKHILCEKPVSVDLESTLPVLAAQKAHPEIKCMVAFVRRFDASNKAAYDQLASIGGKSYMVKSATMDRHDPSGFFVPFAATSGGIVLDCGIHDIDAARWFLGFAGAESGTKQVKRCFTIGQNACHPELAEHQDVDNATCLVEFIDGRQLNFSVSRTATHGHECFTEVYGTEVKVVVNQNPALNRCTIMDKHGVRTESTPTYYERFADAFVAEARAFTACILDDTPAPTTLADGFEAAKIAIGATMSLRSGEQVLFDDFNFPIAPKGYQA